MSHLWAPYLDDREALPQKITGIFPLKINTRGEKAVVCVGTLEYCAWHISEGEFRINPDSPRLAPVEIEFRPRYLERGAGGSLPMSGKGART